MRGSVRAATPPAGFVRCRSHSLSTNPHPTIPARDKIFSNASQKKILQSIPMGVGARGGLKCGAPHGLAEALLCGLVHSLVCQGARTGDDACDHESKVSNTSSSTRREEREEKGDINGDGILEVVL